MTHLNLLENFDVPPSRPQLISRFSIVLIAVSLLGMGVGSTLPPGFGPITTGAGLIGFVAYGCFEFAAYRHYRVKLTTLQHLAEHRLNRHMLGDSPFHRPQNLDGSSRLRCFDQAPTLAELERRLHALSLTHPPGTQQ